MEFLSRFVEECTSEGLFLGKFRIFKSYECFYIYINNSCHLRKWDTSRNTGSYTKSFLCFMLFDCPFFFFFCLFVFCEWDLFVTWNTQATLAPPATGKMVKGLSMCYSVIFVTFYSAAVSGYWAFGSKSTSNILKSLIPDEGPALAPTWVLGLAVVLVLFQLFAIGLVRSSNKLPFYDSKKNGFKI